MSKLTSYFTAAVVVLGAAGIAMYINGDLHTSLQAEPMQNGPGLIPLKSEQPEKISFDGAVTSGDTEPSPSHIKNVCIEMEGQIVSASVDADMSGLQAENVAAEVSNAKVDMFAHLPLSASEEMERATVSGLPFPDSDDEDNKPEQRRADLLKQTLELKAILRDAASSMFSEYDVRRFYMADTHDDAMALDKGLAYLRKHVFLDIVEPAPGSIAAPPKSLNDEGQETLIQFVTDMMNKIDNADEDNPVDVTDMFRNYIVNLDDLRTTTSTPEDVVDSSINLGLHYYELFKHSASSSQGAPYNLNEAMQRAADQINNSTHGAVKITYKSQPNCAP